MDANQKDRYFAGIYGGITVLLVFLPSSIVFSEVPTMVECVILWLVAMIWYFVCLKK